MDLIIQGLQSALQPTNIAFIALGIFLGISVGAIPGLGAPMAVAIAVPLTFGLSPLVAIAFLVGINKGSEFGGSISAILLNTPGTPEAAMTALDGHPLAKKGKAGKALKIALYASVTGDLFSDIVLILVAAPLAIIATKMGPIEILGVLTFALTFVGGLVNRSFTKGIFSASLGILLSLVGLDPETGTPRLTFGVLELEKGIPIAAFAIGLLAFSEVIAQLLQNMARSPSGSHLNVQNRGRGDDDRATWKDLKSVKRTIFRSAVIGTVIGAIPGLGASLAGFLGYSAAKRASKHPERFGQGELDGVAATEAANSAVAGANLIPLLTLGIPGSSTAALLVGAFLIHGVTIGPLVFKDDPVLVYGLFASMLLANFLNLGIGNIGLRLFIVLSRIPMRYMMPVIALLCFTGAYVSGNGMFAVGIMIFFGVLGYYMGVSGFSAISLLIGFILGPLFERSLRNTVIMIDEPSELLNHPVFLAMIALGVIVIWRMVRSRRHP